VPLQSIPKAPFSFPNPLCFRIIYCSISWPISSMRFPTFPTIFRTIYTLSNYSVRVAPQYKALQPFTRGTILRSMPTIPFLSSFFSTSNSSKMSYPLQKSDDEWRAVLSKGSSPFPSALLQLTRLTEQFRVLRQQGTESPGTGV
jgi:peptide-methionine (R)-S-oxide reductase